MELSMYFDKMTHDGLLILESHFVSRMSSADYIMKEKERYNKNQEHFSSFTRAKSAALTERSMRASKMNLNPPKILKHYETNKTSTYKRNKSEEDVVEQTQLKTDHSLTFVPFLQAMQQCISVPYPVSTIIFSQLCRGEPQRMHQSYEKYISDPKLQDFVLDVASGLFIGCKVIWNDLLNYLATKTTLVEPPVDLRLQKKKCPASFAHRLTIDALQFIPELHCYFSSGRDGLAQFWAANGVSQMLNFQTVDEFNFGMKDKDMDQLVNERCDPSLRRGRLDKIQIMSDVLSGKIDMQVLDGMINILPQYIQNNSMLPFSLVQSLQNPFCENTAFPLKNEVGEEDFAHKLTVACRVADAPLPSGFPLPQTIYRTIKFKGYSLHSNVEEKDDGYDPKAVALEKILMNRMRSQSTRQRNFRQFDGYSKQFELPVNDIDSLYLRAETPGVNKKSFRRRVNPNKAQADFYGEQHPIFQQRTVEKQQYINSNKDIYKQKQKIIDENEEVVKVKNEQLQKNFGAGKGNSWASAVCFQSDKKLTISTNDRQVLIYSLTKTGFELLNRLKIDAIAVQNCIRWDRMISKIKTDDAKKFIEQEFSSLMLNGSVSFIKQRLVDFIKTLSDSRYRNQLVDELKDIDSFDEYPFISFKKKVIFQKLLESCLIDECDLPDPGCAYKYTEMIVYQSSKEIGFINYKTKKVIKQYTIEEIMYRRFQEYQVGGTQFDPYDLSFTCIQALGDKLIVGLNDGCVVKLDNLSLKVETSDDEIQVFQNQVTHIQWSQENQMMAVSSVSGQIVVFSYQSKADRLATMQDSGSILKLFISDVYECILSVCANGVLTVWSMKSYTQLHKIFIDDILTCACWDEQNSLLIVGHVSFQTFKLLGVKKEKKQNNEDQKDNKQDISLKTVFDVKVFPQAHYVKIIGVINMDEIKILNKLTLQQDQSIKVDAISQDDDDLQQSEDDIEAERNVINGLKYQPEPYKRQTESNQYYTLDGPTYKPSLVTPFTQFRQQVYMTETAQPKSIGYSKDKSRALFVDQIKDKKFKMLDYEALFERVNQSSGKVLSKRKSKTTQACTGADLMQIVDNSKYMIQKQVEQQTGFITVDAEANLRHWDTKGQILATYKVDIPQDEQIINCCLDINSCTVILNTNMGNSINFRFVTSELNRQFNVSNCARSAFLLQYDGPTLIDNKETSQFQDYMKNYKPRKYSKVNATTQFQQATAYACGEYVLLFNQDSRRLSGRFVQKLLQQNSHEALKLADGLTNPPSMLLHGHDAPVICLASAGRKLISADEFGVVCFWLGQGISKGTIQIKQDCLFQVMTSYHEQLWGYVVQKDGTVIQIDNIFQQKTIFQYETSGVENMSIQKHDDPVLRTTKFAISIQDRVIVCSVDLEDSITIIGFYMSDCHHEIICMDFVNDGAELCVACDGGHLFVINLTIEVERQFDLYYLKQNKFCLNKDENAIFDNSFLPARILTVSLSDKLGLEKFQIPENTLQYFSRLDKAQADVDKRTATERKISLRDFGNMESKQALQISQAVISNMLVGAQEREIINSLPEMKQMMSHEKKPQESEIDEFFTF